MNRAKRTLVVGIGSDHGDDRLGWLAVDWLREQPGELEAVRLRTPLDLLDRLPGVDRLVVIDAALGALPTGVVHRYEWPAVPADPAPWTGTHGLGILEALRLAEALATLPASTVLLVGTVPREEAETRDPACGLTSVAQDLVKSLGERALTECQIDRMATVPSDD